MGRKRDLQLKAPWVTKYKVSENGNSLCLQAVLKAAVIQLLDVII